ncbi:MAG: RidA family protein [Planctomycetota bacterium]|nr:RidA family protein [Planctomycetota bacterium]
MGSHTSPEQSLAALGLVLPAAPAPVAAYTPTRRVGNLLWVSGQIALRDGKLVASGAVPSVVGLEAARECAVQCCLNGLAQIRAAAGTLDAVRQVVRLGVWVWSDATFTEQPKVANAASELLVQVFGDAGRHARAAVGSVALPLGSPVEIEFLVEVA